MTTTRIGEIAPGLHSIAMFFDGALSLADLRSRANASATAIYGSNFRWTALGRDAETGEHRLCLVWWV